MRTLAFVGALLVLLLPFSLAFTTFELLGFETRTRQSLGLVYYSINIENDIADSSDSDTFQSDWVDENDHYSFYFGVNGEDGMRYMGLVILILLIISMAFAVIRENENIAALILIVCGVLLFLLRLRVLSDADTSFYDSQDNIGSSFTYFELPLGLLLSLIFGILDIKKGK